MQTSLPPSSALLAQFNNIIHSPQVQQIEQKSLAIYFSDINLAKVISVLLSALFITGTIIFMIKTGWLALRVDRVEDAFLRRDTPKKRSIKAWRGIKRHFFAGDENSLRIALLEADKVLEEALRLNGFQGETLGDRLKSAKPEDLPNLEQIWEAHKLRNRLVHETDFKLNRDLAERALTAYEQAFKDLGLLD